MVNNLERVSAFSWIAIAALVVLVATAPLTLPARYQFLLTLLIYLIVSRQIWFFVRSKASTTNLVKVLVALLIIHNPMVAVYLKNQRFWVIVVVYTGVVLLYLEIRLVLAQQKNQQEHS